MYPNEYPKCEHLANEYIHDGDEVAGSIIQTGMYPDCGLTYFERWHRTGLSSYDDLNEYEYIEVSPVWHERIVKIATENLLSQIDQIKELTTETSAATGRAITAEKRLKLIKSASVRKFATIRKLTAETARKMALPGSHRERDAQALAAIYETMTAVMMLHDLEDYIDRQCETEPAGTHIDDIPF